MLLCCLASALPFIRRLYCLDYGRLFTFCFRNKEWIAKKKMNAFLAVAKGSAEDPWLFEASYHGSSREQTDVVLVGKGMTNLVAVCKKNILYIAMSSSVLVNNLMKYVKS